MSHVPMLGDRRLFPDLEARAYLNHAAISPPSLPVRRAVTAALEDYARLGVDAFMGYLEQRERLRASLAHLIGAQADDIGFVLNTSQGITTVAQCFDWQPGDRLMLLEGEFPTNITPWQQAAARYDLEIVWLTVDEVLDPEGGLERLASALDQGVRLLALSAVEFQTGWRMPLERIGELCHARGVALCVDAIQACGVVPIDVRRAKIDFLACGGHKWMMGLEGAGFYYVAPERIESFSTHLASWLSHDEATVFLFEGPGHLRYDRPIRQRADFVEGGVVNVLGYAALEASLALLLELDVAHIFAHVRSLCDVLERALVERGFLSAHRGREDSLRAGIVSVRPPADTPLDVLALWQALGELGISCSTPDGWLRFSPHWPNAPGEVEIIAEALDTIMGR